MRIVSGVKVLALALVCSFMWVAPLQANNGKFTSIGAVIKHQDTLKKLEALPENVDKYDVLCQDELTWLACAIYFEARGESLEGQRKVALSVLARVYDRRWPNTVEKVVRQGEGRLHRCQYSFRCDGKPDRIADAKAWTTALMLAEEAMKGADVTCAHSYHADYVTSKTALVYFTTLSAHEQVGRHIFFCDKQKKAKLF